MIHPDLLNLLICPACKSDKLIYQPEPEQLICQTCNRVYPVVDDIPIMVADRPDGATHAE